MSIPTNDENFYIKHQLELESSRKKFPSNRMMFEALVEEVGELATALMKYESDEGRWSDVINEAVQVAVTAQRIATEGDSLPQ